MNIDTNNRSIHLGDIVLENWGHVRWLRTFIKQNGEMLWGKEDGGQEKSATVLSLVTSAPAQNKQPETQERAEIVERSGGGKCADN